MATQLRVTTPLHGLAPIAHFAESRSRHRVAPIPHVPGLHGGSMGRGATRLKGAWRYREPQRKIVQAVAPSMTVQDITPPFLYFNTGITYAWILLVAAPRWSVTQALMKNELLSVMLPSLAFVYFFVSASMIDATSSDELAAKVVFLFTEAITDPVKMASMATPAYAAQDWVHLLVWDWVVGRYIYLDALVHKLPVRFSLLITFNSGPPGLLVHMATKAALTAWRTRQADSDSEHGGVSQSKQEK